MECERNVKSKINVRFSEPRLKSIPHLPISLLHQFVDGVLFRALLLGGDAGHRRRRLGVDDVAAAQRRSRLYLQHGRPNSRLFPRQRRLSCSRIRRLLERISEKRTEPRGSRHTGRIFIVLGDRLFGHHHARYDLQGMHVAALRVKPFCRSCCFHIWGAGFDYGMGQIALQVRQ